MPLEVDDRDLAVFLRREFGSEPMPKKLHGKKLTAAEHRQWKHVHRKTGSGAQATAALKKSRRGKK